MYYLRCPVSKKVRHAIEQKSMTSIPKTNQKKKVSETACYDHQMSNLTGKAFGVTITNMFKET